MTKKRKTIAVDDAFGKLKVIEQPYMAARGSECLFDVKCQCECGNIKVVPYRYLEKGLVDSCPVCAGENTKSNHSIKLSDVYGKLQVLEEIYEGGDGEGYINLKKLYRCKCIICNKEVKVTKQDLVTGAAKSCKSAQ